MTSREGVCVSGFGEMDSELILSPVRLIKQRSYKVGLEAPRRQ